MTDPTQYRSIVGALQYVTLTRPDIAYCVNKICQFLANPRDTHWRAVKRILCYLQGTSNYGLLFQPAPLDTHFSLRAYCDSDSASDPDDRRNTSGSCLFFGPNLVSWRSKKQTLVARSSAEAEYHGMANATADLLWVLSLLGELQVTTQAPILLCDNLSAGMLSHNPVLHARTKHLKLDIHFVREKVAAKQLTIQHVPGVHQLVDALTNPLSAQSFTDLRFKLKMIPYSSPHMSLKEE